MSEIRLTQTVSCAGCAGKIAPAFLKAAVSEIDWYSNQHVLAAFAKCEDCGVYQLDEHHALIHTTDFFSPVVDDPFIFGQIAAANALSDIYAMGGRPLSALNIVAYNTEFGTEVLRQILRGGEDKAREAGCPIIGGHSVRAGEIKYGLAVNGIVSLDSLKLNSTAKPGDLLILTKALGTGILNTAVKHNDLPAEYLTVLIDSMRQLNQTAGDLAVRYGVSAMTDVTGFGLLGHGLEMANGAGMDLCFYAQELPVLPGVSGAIAKNYLTGGGKNNHLFVADNLILKENLSHDLLSLIFDPQTSGGLLMAIHPEQATELCSELQNFYPFACVVGEVRPRSQPDKSFLYVQ